MPRKDGPAKAERKTRKGRKRIARSKRSREALDGRNNDRS